MHRYMSVCKWENVILFKADKGTTEYVDIPQAACEIQWNEAGMFGLLRFYTTHVMLRR